MPPYPISKHQHLGFYNSCIRISWRYASEHRALFSVVLLLYLLYISSPGFCAFLLSSSPVIICTTILIGTLLSYGIKDLPEMDESETAPDYNPAPKFGSHSRNVYSEAYTRSLVPAVKENIIREASFGRRHSNKHLDVDEDVPLLEGGCQGDDEVDAAGSRLGKMLISIPSAETMQQDAAMVDKDAFLSKKDEHANLFDAVHQSGVDGKETTVKEDVEIMTEPDHQGRAESQSGEVGLGDVSEHKAADGEAGRRRWGRAFSVRQRKKLADIKIEAINPAAENQLDYSLSSPLTRAGSHDYDCLAGFDPDNAEIYSLDVPMTNAAPVPDATEADPFSGADFSSPDPTANNNDNSENNSNVCSLDSGTDSGRNDVADNGKTKEDGEEKRKDAGNEPAFLWTADDEKNGTDLGYSEMERNRRLEILMARRKSRKHMSFELEGIGVSSFRPHALAISARRLNPFADDAEVPGSAPPVLHLRKDPFDFLSEQSNDSDTPAPHSLNPQEPKPALRQDMPSFKRHESFSFGRPWQRHVPRFKPLEEFSLDEAAGASDFQRQFSVRSVSRLSVVSECDTVSSVGDPEHNELIRN
jgi:hypothetical protein